MIRVLSSNPSEPSPSKHTLGTSSHTRDGTNLSGDIIEVWPQIGMVFAPQGHLIMFGGIFGYQNSGEGCYCV